VLGYLFIGRRVRDMLLREEREIDEQQSAK